MSIYKQIYYKILIRRHDEGIIEVMVYRIFIYKFEFNPYNTKIIKIWLLFVKISIYFPSQIIINYDT